VAERVAAALAGPLGRVGAHGLVQRLARQAADTGQPLRAVLAADFQVRQHLGEADLDRLLDPEGYLGTAEQLIDRALATHRAGRAARPGPGDGTG
jgi:3-carboxy-cis,cis-muconate cycloisomerase